jgi:hypothetical protein
MIRSDDPPRDDQVGTVDQTHGKKKPKEHLQEPIPLLGAGVGVDI